MSTMAAAVENEFNLQRLYEFSSSCKAEGDTIMMARYLEVYIELCRFFHILGKVFGFVSSDVRDKVNILQRHAETENGSYYVSVQSMISYETKHDITVVKCKKRDPSGSRTLLRLHRALEFVIYFLQRLHSAHESDKISCLAAEAYNKTLAKHHPWLIKKAVNMAVYCLPTRKQLMETMCPEYDCQECTALLIKVVEVLNPIYDIVQKLYEDYKLLDLQ